jgi:hypothetical protein
MIEALVVAVAVVIAALVLRRRRDRPPPAGRILFPFVGGALSERALDACLRLASAENAVLVPAYLVAVPMSLHLDAPVPRACDKGFELLEAIEQRAAAAGVPVDARIGRGRTLRHAMRDVMAAERYDRIVVAVGDDGFSADDVAWLLRNADGEVLALRPSAESRMLRAAMA